MNPGRGRRGTRTAPPEADATEEYLEPSPRRASYLAVFTEVEKREELRGQVFRGSTFDRVDFSRADLSFALFHAVRLTGCNFSHANLRGVTFFRCDLRGSSFEHVRLGKNTFDTVFFAESTGLTHRQRLYVQRHGGTFTLDAPGAL